MSVERAAALVDYCKAWHINGEIAIIPVEGKMKKYLFACAVVFCVQGCGLEEVVEHGETCPGMKYIHDAQCTVENGSCSFDKKDYSDFFKNSFCPEAYPKCLTDNNSVKYCDRCEKGLHELNGECVRDNADSCNGIKCSASNDYEIWDCIEGQCQLQSCKSGYYLNDNGDKCMNDELCGDKYCNENVKEYEIWGCVENQCQLQGCRDGHYLKDGTCYGSGNAGTGTGEGTGTGSADKCCSAEMIANSEEYHCDGEQCIIDKCKAGYYINDNACVENDDENCGELGRNCSTEGIEHAENVKCSMGSCVLSSCESGYYVDGSNCKENDDNNCAVLGKICTGMFENADEVHCVEDTCVITACDADHYLKDNACLNNDTDNCGYFGNTCNLEHAEVVDCVQGTCRATSCQGDGSEYVLIDGVCEESNKGVIIEMVVNPFIVSDTVTKRSVKLSILKDYLDSGASVHLKAELLYGGKAFSVGGMCIENGNECKSAVEFDLLSASGLSQSNGYYVYPNLKLRSPKLISDISNAAFPDQSQYKGVTLSVTVTGTAVPDYHVNTDTEKFVVQTVVTKTLNYKGTGEMVALPKGKYLLEVHGASGSGKTVEGGAGGTATAELTLKEKRELWVFVGGAGNSCKSMTSCGGYNGGAKGSSSSGGLRYGHGGGGASDIRLCANGTICSDVKSNLENRFIVAGGGGGGYYGTKKGSHGGGGGGENGGTGTGKNGTASGGGQSGCVDGKSKGCGFGVACTVAAKKGEQQGGGGGGWFSGMTGSADENICGGGGSGYAFDGDASHAEIISIATSKESILRNSILKLSSFELTTGGIADSAKNGWVRIEPRF